MNESTVVANVQGFYQKIFDTTKRSVSDWISYFNLEKNHQKEYSLEEICLFTSLFNVAFDEQPFRQYVAPKILESTHKIYQYQRTLEETATKEGEHAKNLSTKLLALVALVMKRFGCSIVPVKSSQGECYKIVQSKEFRLLNPIATLQHV